MCLIGKNVNKITYHMSIGDKNSIRIIFLGMFFSADFLSISLVVSKRIFVLTQNVNSPFKTLHSKTRIIINYSRFSITSKQFFLRYILLIQNCINFFTPISRLAWQYRALPPAFDFQINYARWPTSDKVMASDVSAEKLSIEF